MVSGVLILHYYLKVFNLFLIFLLIFVILSFVYVFNKKINLNDNNIVIEKGENLEKILYNNIKNINYYDILISKIYYQSNKFFNNSFIHFGNFYIKKNSSILDFLNLISKPSNKIYKITIVEGWSKKRLNKELSKIFNNYYDIPYEDILADTYFINKNENFKSFHRNLINIKNQFLDTYENNEIYKFYNDEELMIIGSLIEKEGLDIIDKGKISSVIFNRLNNKMKLQIDATVLYAITNGNFDLNRSLLYKDLKIDHPYNTYIYKGLPPKPISYVGKKTLEIIFENQKTDFLFYFFNYSLNRHIFSNTYEEHKKKLNEYRNK